MRIQIDALGKITVDYVSDGVDYQSPILVGEVHPTTVTYLDAKTHQHIGTVYRHEDKWWLKSTYYNHWTPVETFSKIEGFFLLQNLHKQHYEHGTQ